MNHENCCCPDCAIRRHNMVLACHPLHSKRDKDPGPVWRASDEAQAIRLEARDDLRVGIKEMGRKLRAVKAEIRAHRDCAQEGQ